MRLLLQLSPSPETLPYNYAYPLAQRLHQWLGRENPYHDNVSLYSFGTLHGAKPVEGGLRFPEGATWRISCWHQAMAMQLMDAIFAAPAVAFGMQVEEVRAQPRQQFGTRYTFFADSPILLKQFDKQTEKVNHITFRHNAALATALLNQSLHTKLQAAALPYTTDDFNLQFVPTASAKTRLIDIHGIKNRASLCPVRIEGPQEVLQLAWLAGVGNSTGVGFGALK